jgi:hypothetical protein
MQPNIVEARMLASARPPRMNRQAIYALRLALAPVPELALLLLGLARDLHQQGLVVPRHGVEGPLREGPQLGDHEVPGRGLHLLAHRLDRGDGRVARGMDVGGLEHHAGLRRGAGAGADRGGGDGKRRKDPAASPLGGV